MTETLAIDAGGWDPRYAVALVVVSRGGIAAALIDSNGDGADIDLDEYRRDPDGAWVAECSSGGAGDSGTSWSPHMVVTYGRAEPNARILVDYHHQTHTVVANDAGWWMFMTASLDEGTLPVSRSRG